MVEFSESASLHDSQRSLHLQLKPEVAKLCEVLQLPDNVKDMVESFLKYIMDNHCIKREPTTILEAFQISLCWTAASLLKHKLDHKESLALAKQRLSFSCNKTEADFVYSMLRCLQKVFLYHTGKIVSSPKASPSSQCHIVNQLQVQSYPVNVDVVVDNLTSGQELSDQVPSLLSLAQEDFSKSISSIEKKYHKRMKKLLGKQQKEIKQFEKQYGEEKAQLEHMQRTEAAAIRLQGTSSKQTDDLKLLDIEYANKFEELKCQMEMCRKVLEDTQLAAQNKLQERKNHWVDGLKSWAQVELINKLVSTETLHNNENFDLLDVSSYSQMQDMSDSGVLHDASKSLSSNGVEDDILPWVSLIADGPAATTLDREVPLEVSSTVIGSQNVVSVNVPSSERQLSVQVTMEVAKDVSCCDDEKNNIHKPSSSEQCQDQPTPLEHDVGSIACLEDATTADPPLSVEGMSGGVGVNIIENEPVTIAPNDVNGSTIGEEEICPAASDNAIRVYKQDGIINNVDQDDPSNRNADENTHTGAISLGLPGNIPCKAVEVGDEDSYSLVNEQGGEISLKVSETTTSEVAKGCGIGGENNNGVSIVPSGHNKEVEQNRLIAPGSRTNIDERSECIDTGGEINRVCTEASGGSTGVLLPDVESNEHDVVASEQVNIDRPLAELVPRSQSLSLESSSPLHLTGLPSASGIESQSNHEGHRTNSGQSPTHLIQNQVELSHQAVVQPLTQAVQLPLDIPGSRLGMNVSDTGSMRSTSGFSSDLLQTTTTMWMHISSFHDPLQNELERIRKETEQTIDIHEKTKLQLESDREKEIDELVTKIRRKYEIKLQEMESEFLDEKGEWAAYEKNVCRQKILADVFRSKCMNTKIPIPPEMRAELTSSVMRHSLQPSSQPLAQRHSMADGLSSDANLAGVLQTTVVSTSPIQEQRIASPPIVSASRLSNTVTRPPHIVSLSPTTVNFPFGSGIRAPAPHLQPFRPSIPISDSPATGNLQVGGGIRAPPPHLQPFRPSTPISTSNISYPSSQMPSQQVPSNPHITSPMFSQFPSPLPPSTSQSVPRNRVHQSEAMGTSLSSTSKSAIELLLNVDSQLNRNRMVPVSLPPLKDLVSNKDPLIPSSNATQRNPIFPGEIVSLSDDD